MKWFKSIGLSLAIVAGMASCDMFNVDVDTSFSGDLNVDVPDQLAKGSMSGIPFSAQELLNPKDDKDVQQYADQIVAVGVDNIEATIKSMTGAEEVTLYKDVTVLKVWNNDTEAAWVLEEDWTISQGSVIQLEDKNNFHADVESILADMEEFTLAIEGESSVGGVSFVITVNIDAVITGSLF